MELQTIFFLEKKLIRDDKVDQSSEIKI